LDYGYCALEIGTFSLGIKEMIQKA
jgi:hypothetical protein